MNNDKINRNLYLLDEVNTTNIEFLIKDIIAINEEDADLQVELREPIKLYINSPGGGVTTALSLISVIEESETPIYAHALGEVQSAALLIFITCHQRIGYKHSLFMYHNISSGGVGDLTFLARQHEYSTELRRRLEEIMLKYTTFSQQELDTICDSRYDHFFYYKEALAKGVIDEVYINEIYKEDVEFVEQNYPDTKKYLNIQELIEKVPAEKLLALLEEHSTQELQS